MVAPSANMVAPSANMVAPSANMVASNADMVAPSRSQTVCLCGAEPVFLRFYDFAE